VELIHGPIRDIQVYICYTGLLRARERESLFIISRNVNHLRFLTDQLYYLRMHDSDISITGKIALLNFSLHFLPLKYEKKNGRFT